MSKRGGFPGMGGFGGMNINNLMKEAKKMQADLEKSQTELAAKEFGASAGGGAVTVKVTGQKEIKELKLQKDVVDPEDVEMLQDLIVTCINQAFKQVEQSSVEELPQNVQNLEYVLSDEVACIGIYARNINLVYQKYIYGFDELNYMSIFSNLNNIGKIAD